MIAFHRRRLARASFAALMSISMLAPQAFAQVPVPAKLPDPPAATQVVGDPRLNGFWFIDDDARRAATSAAKAELAPAGQAIAQRNAEQAARNPRGPVTTQTYTCGPLPLPFVINTSEPWLLVVTKDEVAQYVERRQIPRRRFYTDGRPWPDFSKMPPVDSGYSLAHWEGKELVIQTVGIGSGGFTGGGLRGPNTTLTERVGLDAAGNRLTWTYTWEDPVLLAKPLTVSIQYDRGEAGYAMTHDCDPNLDPARILDLAPAQQ